VNNTKRQRASIYTRVSTDEQAGEGSTSLGEQVRLCQEYIDSRGWDFTGTVYEDAGVSGTIPARQRPGLRTALRDAADSEFDVLIVLNLSRLARKLRISAGVADDLNEVGVGIASAQEAMIDTSTYAGRFVFQQFCAIAELDRESILAKTAGAQRAIARSGRLPGGAPPYGYRREGRGRDSRVVPDAAERATVTLMYDLLVKKRRNAEQVAAHLNDAGIAPRHAERWDASSVRSIGRNPTLGTGLVIWGGVNRSQTGGRRAHKARLNHDGTPKYGEPVTIDLGDPVLTVAQHRSLVRALERRSTGGTAHAPVSRVLTGRVFSAEGHAMYGVNLPREAWEGAYRCSKRRVSQGADRCTCDQLRARPLEDTVWEAVAGLLGDPDRLMAMARSYLALPDEPDAEADTAALSGVQVEIEKLERALSRAERGVLMADSDEDERRQAAVVAGLRSELGAARDRFAGYQALLASAESRGQALRDVAALAERARVNLGRFSLDQRAEVLRILRVSVVVSGPVRKGEPDSLLVSGIVDPRLGFGSEASSAGATAADSQPQSAPGVAGCGPWRSD